MGGTFATAISDLEPEGAGPSARMKSSRKGLAGGGSGPAGLSLSLCHHAPGGPWAGGCWSLSAPKATRLPRKAGQRASFSALPLFLKPLRIQLLYF